MCRLGGYGLAFSTGKLGRAWVHGCMVAGVCTPFRGIFAEHCRQLSWVYRCPFGSVQSIVVIIEISLHGLCILTSSRLLLQVCIFTGFWVPH